MMHGAFWMVLLKLADHGLGFTSMLILVRLLSPADFGIAAMGGSFVALAELLTALGFDYALIQHPKPTQEHYHTAWTCNVLLGSAVTALSLAVAWPVAQFYRQPKVFWVMCALAFGPLLASLENIGIVNFRKELQFRKEFTFRLSRRIFTFLVALPLAFWWRSYWALVVGILINKLGVSVLSYMAHEFRPRFCLEHVKELFGVSKWLLISNIISSLRQRSTDFVIGRWHGAAALGFYGISYEIANTPTADLSASINRALMPGFAKIETGNELRAAYGNAMSVLAMIALPAGAGVYGVAPFLVPVVLGSKWLQSTALVEILAFNGVVLLFHSSICAVLLGRGYPDVVTKTSALYVPLFFGLLALFGAHYGVAGVAYSSLATSVMMTPLYLYHVKRRIGVASEVFLRAITRPAIASILMAWIVRMVLPAYELSMSTRHAASLLIGGAALGVAVYAVAIGLLWLQAGRPASAERLVLARIRRATASVSVGSSLWNGK